MSIYKELSYDNDIEQVKSIRFCILGPNEIKKMSVAEINKTDTYLGTEPVVNGLFDPRMGVLDHNKFCHTCEQKNTFCPGHFGHIVLAKPVFYIQFFDIVRKILKCVCFRCSKLLVDPESPQVKAILNKKYSRQKRWELMYKLCSKVKRCGQETLDGCKAKQPDKIFREPIVKIVMEWKDLDSNKDELKKQVFNAEEVLRILQRISDEDAEVLGFHRKYNRPEWMICTVLPVPPPSVRPSVRSDTGLRSEDDLTHKLCDIVKNNNMLKAKIDKGGSKEQIDIAAQVLQYHVATFIDNNIPGINPAQQRTGRLLKSLTERLRGKEGRIRGNLMGKRVDFSARSVITPDPNISIDELGVPIKIAMNLTFPEVVNKYNREKLMKLVLNGPDVYPGAKCLRQGTRTFLLKNKDRSNIVLNDGDIVERHMMNGDYVLFNRQPSLHRMSMMGHRVVVMPYNTFRSNPSVCPCFNSDYDGDEMNAHLPQSIVTMNELVELAAVPTQIISPRECKPIIAIVQDVPLGVYRLTKSHINMNQKLFFNLMSLNPRFNGVIPAADEKKGDVEKWTGKQILSTIIPRNINIKAPNKSFDGPQDKENFVVIENGIIKQGVIDKLIYQNRTKGLIHSIFSECGPDETRQFFDNTQRIICDWLVNNGFSVGISDLIIDQDTQENLKKVIHDMKVKVYDIINNVHMGNFENRSISDNNNYFEEQVNKILNQASSQAGNKGLAKINDITNRMINMIRSGSKGNVINIAQMIACLGQVNVEGKRIAYGFENRTLPHYTKYDDGPESRGFVESSFFKGLNPQEFFFHSMGGREGLIDTAVKSVTRETEIVIMENGKVKVVEIGDWIDGHMTRCKDRIQYKEEKHTELLELDCEVLIPNMDSKGNQEWSEMKYITRHDPDNELYEVTTESGRNVIVTQYESMLIWDSEKEEFLCKPTKDIKIGEFAPVTSKYPTCPIVIDEVDNIKLDKEFGVIIGKYLANETIQEVAVDVLEKIAGSGDMKYVPQEAIAAPIHFVIGILDGYMGNKNSVSSKSKKILFGISLLLNRLGLFATIINNGTEYILNKTCNFTEINDVVMDPIVSITPVDVSKHPKVYDVTVPRTYNFTLFNGCAQRDTSEIGYLQRKLVKAMEDCKISYDHTVRNASGTIVQFLYGEDGMDPTKIENQNIPYIEMDYTKLRATYLLTSADDLTTFLNNETLAEFKATKDWESTMESHFKQVVADREYMIKEIFKSRYETSIMYPVSFHRIITSACAMYVKAPVGDLNPMYVLSELEKLCETVYVSKVAKGNMFFQILARAYLSPKRVIMEYKFDKNTFDHILQMIRLRFYDSIAHPSEMVGVISAQSIGEPATQMSSQKGTRVRVRRPDGSMFCGKVEDLVDGLLEKKPDKVIKIGEDSVVMDLDEDYHIVGVSNEEKTSWKKISQISRHPANGGLVKVMTRSKKHTTATLTHSFLKRVEKGIVEVKGSDLKKGDRIPVAKYIPIVENPINSIDIGKFKDLKLDNDMGWFFGVYIADGSMTDGGEVRISKAVKEYNEKLNSIILDKFGKNVKQYSSYRKNFVAMGYDKEYLCVENKFNCVELATFLGDNFGRHSSTKCVAPWVFGANKDFICGLLQGYFDGDGNVNCQKGKSMIRAGSISEQLVDDIIVLLAYTGIFASKSVETSKSGKVVKPFHTLQIPRKYGKVFKENIGFTVECKVENLNTLIDIEIDSDGPDSDLIDKIPCLGDAIAFIGKALELPGQSRNYGRWKKKESIGRTTLKKYIKIFKDENAKKQIKEVDDKISILEQAAYSDIVWDEIIDLEYLDDPKEHVYDFTVPGNDSFMVDTGILVHNTLNSVDWNSELLIDINGLMKRVKIGEWIDNELSGITCDKIEDHGNNTKLGWVNEKNIKVLSCDTAGKVEWRLVEAITRHPPINEDGTNTLMKVNLRSGREIIATKAKSFLKRKNNEITLVPGDDLNVGDYLPVSHTVLPKRNNICNMSFDDGMVIGKNMAINNERLDVNLLEESTEFLKGVIRGFYSSTANQTIDVLEDIRQVLSVFGIKSIIQNNNIKIITECANNFESLFELSANSTLVDDIIPDIVTKQYGTITIKRYELNKYITECKEESDRDVFKKIKNEDIYYDEIVSIEHVPSSHEFVYDLTVEGPRTFNLYNGCTCYDTFHLSGVSSASKAVRGVPRMKELMSVTKNIKAPSLTIYLEENIRKNKEDAKTILNNIETTYFKDIVKSSKVYFDPDDFNTSIEEDKLFLATYKEFISEELMETSDLSPWLLRIEFDKEKMREYELTMIDVGNILYDFYRDTVNCMFSDDNSSNLVLRVKLPEIKDEDKDAITELKALEKNIMDNIIIKGLKRINKAVMDNKEYQIYNDETMTFEKTNEWVIDTNGTNLIDILGYKGVDKTRTISNDINEIYEVLGIEAARNALYAEMSDIIKDADLYVNYRHIALLVDTMTNKGYLLSIDRHGINRVDIGPLAKCSFEEVTDMLVKAGIFAEVDKISGVSANIMLGQIPAYGTGDTDVLIDEARLKQLFKDAPMEMENEVVDKYVDNVCSVDNMGFDFELPVIEEVDELNVEVKVA